MTWLRRIVEPQPDVERRALYDRLLSDEFADGEGTLIVFLVYTSDLDEGRGDVYVAAGLGLALVDLGYRVRLVPRAHWHLVDAADVVVAMMPICDPSLVPANALRVAWVRNQTDTWAKLPHLPAYDVVLASSQISLDRLAEVTPRTVGVLRIGVDTDLFHPAAGGARSISAVTTAHHWGTLRAVHRAILDTRRSELVMYGNVTKRAPRRLRARARKPISYFAMADLYRRSVAVVDDLNDANLGFGNLNSRFFESAACGAVPVVNGTLGLHEIGITDLPTYRDGVELRRALAGLRADPARTQARGQELAGLVAREHSWPVRAHQFVELVMSAGRDAPRRSVHFGPDYTSTNPYQSMLYAGLGDHGAYCVPVAVDGMFAALERLVASPAEPGTFHLHWTAPIIQPAVKVFDAAARLEAFTDLLEQFKARGGRLVWTVHNVLPHDGRHLPIEAELARRLVRLADVVHVLSDNTAAAARDHYAIPADKSLTVRLSSYRDVYPDWISPEAARARLGLSKSDKVILALGGIRPYKGLDRLVDVVEGLAATGVPVRLLVAGEPGAYRAVEQLRQRCEASRVVVSNFEYLPDSELQVWLNAADIAALPYTAILNSAAFTLAESFSLPIVAPRAGALAAREGSAHVRLFDPRSDDDLQAGVEHMLAEACSERRDLLRASAKAAADAWTPADMARAFATHLF